LMVKFRSGGDDASVRGVTNRPVRTHGLELTISKYSIPGGSTSGSHRVARLCLQPLGYSKRGE
jgi:hypothetical protein